MVNCIKKIITVVLIIMICLFVAGLIINKTFIIKGYSHTYSMCGIIISGAALFILTLIKKLYEYRKVLMTLSVTIIIFITFLLCFLICGTGKQLRDDQQFYSIYVDGLSDEYELTLYEYNAFRSNSGCLCIKVNDFLYKRIPETHYEIESGLSLSDPGNLMLDYNSESGVLTMKYRTVYMPGTASDYIENTTKFFSDK